MSATMKGLSEALAALASLPENLERNILRGAVRAGAEEYAEGAREGCRSAEVRATIKVSTRAEPGVVTAKVQTKGPGSYKAPWLEFGTDPHFISVDPEISGGRTARRVNRLVEDGKTGVADTLVINGKPVGKTVEHPGAQDFPFMRPAADTRGPAAIAAVGNYIGARLTKEGLTTPAPPEPEE
jgi:hypothetical protein